MLFVCHGEISCHGLVTIEKPSMNRGALSWFHNVCELRLLNIEYFFTGNSFKSKLKIIGEFRCSLAICWRH
jgi:hypothetical protein